MKNFFLIIGIVLMSIITFNFVTFIFDILAIDMCKNSIFKELNSPDNRLKAVVFQRDCGATTGFNTQISILSKDKKLNNESTGNILILDGKADESISIVNWKNNQELHIKYNKNKRIYKIEKRFGWINPIKIIYQK